MDAIAFGLLKRAVGELEHPNRSGSRLIPFKWIPGGKLPSPIGAGNGIPGPFGLSQRGKEAGGNDGCRVFFKERPIFTPGFPGAFVEGTFNGEKEFCRLADGMVGPIDGEEHDEQYDRAESKPHYQRGFSNCAGK